MLYTSLPNKERKEKRTGVFLQGFDVDEDKEKTPAEKIFEDSINYLEHLSSPRIIRTHLPFEMLPQDLLNKVRH